VDAVSGIAGLTVAMGTNPLILTTNNIVIGPTQIMSIESANINVSLM
jgi:hypothetical protein